MLAKHYGFTDEKVDFFPSAGFRAGINDDTGWPVTSCVGRGAGEKEWPVIQSFG
jgi:hypothetical protein